jgi:glucokinase
MSDRARVAVGVDVGATKIAGALVDAAGQILRREGAPTPDDLDEALAAIASVAARLNAPDAPLGVGVPGLVDRDGVMRSGANVRWRDARIAARLHEALGVPVTVDNDCTAGAMGEWRAGAAVGFDDVLYVGVGTGIGGGLIVGGHPYRGAHGFAGEIGHIVMEPDGQRCGCGNRGCWETLASGDAITRQGRAAVTRLAHSMLAEIAGDPDAVTGEVVTEAAEAGDPAARGILAEVGTRLGEGIAALVNVLDPAVVVIGGGAVRAGGHLLGPARTRFAALVEGDDRRDLPIVAARLGAESAMVGAALLALEEPT